MSDQLFEPGDRVEIVVSTGYGHISGRFISNDDRWLRLGPATRNPRLPVRLVQISHIVTIYKTEEQ